MVLLCYGINLYFRVVNTWSNGNLNNNIMYGGVDLIIIIIDVKTENPLVPEYHSCLQSLIYQKNYNNIIVYRAKASISGGELREYSFYFFAKRLVKN